MTLAWVPTRSIHRSIDIGWRRSRRLAMRRLAPASPSSAKAAASPARSLSANDSTATSPAGWRRSTGAAISSKVVAVVARRCMASPVQGARDAVAVEALEADHHEVALAAVRRRPGPAELMRPPCPHRLDEEPHRLAGNRRKALDAQHLVALGEYRDISRQCLRVGD